jgi:hypothetical protein
MFQLQNFSEKLKILCRIRKEKYFSSSESLTASFRSKNVDFSPFLRIFATFPPKSRPNYTAERSESTLIFFKDAFHRVQFEKKNSFCHSPLQRLILVGFWSPLLDFLNFSNFEAQNLAVRGSDEEKYVFLLNLREKLHMWWKTWALSVNIKCRQFSYFWAQIRKIVKKASGRPEKGQKLAVRGSTDKNVFFSNSTTNFTSVTQNLVRNTHKPQKSLSKVSLSMVLYL